MKVCCLYSLESPQRGDSDEYTQYTVFIIKKKITRSTAIGLKKEFETAVVNEPSVFGPLKFHRINKTQYHQQPNCMFS